MTTPSPAPRPHSVLHVEGNVDGTIGGSYYSLLFLASGLDRTRYRPRVAFHRANSLQPRYEAAGVPTLVVPKPAPFAMPGVQSALARRVGPIRTVLQLVQSGVNFARYFVAGARYARLLRRERVDLLHLNNSVTRGHDWMLGAWLARVPCVVHERGVNSEFSGLARFFAPRLAAVIAISEAARRSLTDHGVTRDNITVIHNGVDPAKVQPTADAAAVRAEYGIDPSRRVVGLVGNIRWWKGQDVLVRAIPALRARVPDVVCVLVGDTAEPDKPYEQELRALIAALGVERHVVFTGYRANPADVLAIVDVAAHTSVMPEPFGRVLLEAMAVRKPIVGSGDGAIPEIIEDGVTGWLFEPKNHEHLADRLADLLEHPDRARAMGEAGYARLEARFHVVNNVGRTMDVYDRALGRPPRP